MARRLFVAVATGQNVANLPPILELAEEGDGVVWLESPQSQQGKWTAGANEVLQRRGLEVYPSEMIREINDYAAIVEACANIVGRRGDGCQLYVVVNGGTKLTKVGLYSGFYEVRATFLYGSDRPVELRIFPDAFQEQAIQRSYRRADLALKDVLCVAGYRLLSGVPIWPEGSPLSPPSPEKKRRTSLGHPLV